MLDLVLVFYKFVLTTLIVIILSFIAEYIHPRWAGILSGLPTSTSIILYFYAIEQGVPFAKDSAIYNLVGLIALQLFLFCYYLGGIRAHKHTLLFSIASGLTGYALAILLLSRFSFTALPAVLLSGVSLVIFRVLFSHIPSSKITSQLKPTATLILGRAGMAALIISIITGIAGFVGHTWAGLLSTFPSTIFPLILIIHLSYGAQYAHSIIKHVPVGLGSVLIYSLILYTCYPRIGLYSGILIAFCGVLLYFILYYSFTHRPYNPKQK
jgi:hypothetical protein